MNTENNNFDNRDMFKDELEQAQRLGESITGSLKGKLIRWAIRWIIGFAIIAVTVHYKPQWQWLWYAGAIVAGLSLFMMIFLRQLVQKRLDRLNERAEEARRFADEVDAEGDTPE